MYNAHHKITDHHYVSLLRVASSAYQDTDG